MMTKHPVHFWVGSVVSVEEITGITRGGKVLGKVAVLVHLLILLPWRTLQLLCSICFSS